MTKKQSTGIKRILNAFVHSKDGFISAFKSEIAFRQDLLIFAVFTLIAAVLNISLWHKFVLISVLLFILFAELVNTAIETLVDRISTDSPKLSKKAKDIGSMLVLMSFINAIMWWCIVLFMDFM